MNNFYFPSCPPPNDTHDLNSNWQFAIVTAQPRNFHSNESANNSSYCCVLSVTRFEHSQGGPRGGSNVSGPTHTRRPPPPLFRILGIFLQFFFFFFHNVIVPPIMLDTPSSEKLDPP